MTGRVVILTGGVGGSKLVYGLARRLAPDDLCAIVNTGDDFSHFGLHVSPDADTLLYTLAGLAHPEQGWGRADESWNFMESVGSLGGEQWFRLGDRDLALHVLRTQALGRGVSLASVIAQFARKWGIRSTIFPMTNDRVSTMIETDEGLLSFQDYFVGNSCRPEVREIRFEGAASADPAPGVIHAISNAEAIFVAPSNPFLSIDPILAIPAVRKALKDASAPIIAVSPLVGGRAVKGPTAKIMQELELPVSAAAIAHHYEDFLTGMIIDERDPPPTLNIPSIREDTLMVEEAHRARLAGVALAFAEDLR